jgi:hypothetical protein
MVLDEECGGLQSQEGESPVRKTENHNNEQETVSGSLAHRFLLFFVPMRSVFEREAQLQRDLPMSDPSAFDVTSGVHYLKPPEIPNRLRGLRHCLLYGILHAFG